MTHDEFIELQKECFKENSPKWDNLIDQYNRKNKTNLEPFRRTTYIVILMAIAQKQNFDFHAKDIQQYSPIKSVFQPKSPKSNE